MSEIGKYCPYCKRHIQPCNIEEVESGEHDGYIYIHDDVWHPEDFKADDFEVMQ